MLKRAVDIQVQATLPDLKAAATVLNAEGALLDSQKLQIDRIVKAVNTAATIITDVEEVVSAAASLAALF
jgi:hypothetical protein